jgi:hypothetical protein
MTSMPSMPGMGGGMMPPQDPNQFLPRMGADPRMMLPRTGPMPQQQGGMGNTLAQIMGSVQGQQQQPVSPWGSGGPMRARGGSTY